MDEGDRDTDGAPHPEKAGQDRLDSWKQIAVYMGRGVTTVQRWEQDEGLPVRRLPHAKKGSVFAFKRDLDAWLTARAMQGAGRTNGGTPASPDALPEPAPRRWPLRFVAIGGAFFLGVIGLVAMLYGPSDTRNATAIGTIESPVASSTAVPSPDLFVPRPLANDAEGELSPTLSPDGSQVAYGWERAPEGFGVYIKAVSGGTPRKLDLGPDIRFEESPYPAWSPRGDLIAFLGYEAPQMYGLFVVSPSGGTPRRLTSMSGIGLCWHPDGTSIGFVDRHSTGEPFSVFSISLDTGHRRRVTAPAMGVFGDTHCAFSPDGRRLALVRYDSRHASDVFVMDGMSLDDEPSGDTAARTRRLTHDLPGLDGIAWTPDAAALIVGSHNGLWRVSTTDPQPAAPALVAAFAGGAGAPSFARSPRDGRTRLAYHYEQRDVNLWWWRERVGTLRGATSPLLAGSASWEDSPALSPDGRQVAFTSNRTGVNEIWVAAAAGAAAASARQVTFHGPVVMAPQWSPDGRTLAFVRQVNGNRDIYAIGADGTHSTRLTWEPTQEDNPTWSRDGRWIYFRSDRTSIGQIWKVASHGGGTAVQVTTGPGSQAFESPDGRLLYFVRSTDAPGLWAMPIGGGAETPILPDVREGLWGVADSGIAFIDRSHLRSPDGLPIRFYDFASRTTTTRATIAMAAELTSGFAIARDGRSALWSTVDRVQHDLMVIDPWTR